MPTNDTVIEVLRFTAQGVDEVEARIKVYRDEIDAVAARQKALQGLLNDPTYVKHAERVEGMNRAYQQGEVLLRNRIQAQGLESGQAARHAAIMLNLNRSYDLTNARLRNQVAAADLASGAYYRNARAVAQVKQETMALSKEAAFQQLVAEQGRFGAVVKTNEQELRLLGQTAAGTLNSVTAMSVGLMRAGLSGTVEGYALELAWQRVSQQIAGIAVPAINSFARGVNQVATWFRSLNGDQQKWLLGLGLAAVALGPILRLVTLIGMGMRAIAAIGGSGLAALRLGGTAVPAAAASAASGSMIAGMSSAALASGTGAGLAARGARGGWIPATMGGFAAPAAIGAAAQATGYGGEAVGLGAAYGAFSGYRAGTGILRGAARFALPLAAGAIAYEGLTGGYWSHFRGKAGGENNKLVSGLYTGAAATVGTVAGWIGLEKEFKNALGMDTSGRKFRNELPGTPSSRTDVHPMTTEVLEGGESARRVQHAVLLHGAGEASEGDKTTDDLINFLAIQFNALFEKLGLPPVPPAGR